MATTVKTTMSLERTALEIGQEAAQRAGKAWSAWVSDAVRYYALVTSPGPRVSEVEQLRDEEELAAEEAAHP